MQDPVKRLDFLPICHVKKGATLQLSLDASPEPQCLFKQKL